MTLAGVSRKAAVGSAALVAIVATSTIASASLALSFDRASGPTGSRISVHTISKGSCSLCPPSLPLFFVPAGSVDTVQSRDDPLLTPVGRLQVNSQGDGAGRIVVPMLSPGSYMVMAYCETCAATSAGRQLLPVGPFPKPFELVEGKRPTPPSSPAGVGRSPIVVIVVAAGLAALSGSLLYALRRHRNRDASGRC